MANELSRVVDALPGLVWTALPNGHTDFVNRRWREYTGLTGEEASGPGWMVALHPDDRPASISGWNAILASGKPGELQARLRRCDGAYRWFHFRASPLADASGRIVKWCGINTDIEDRKRTEEALREHERRSSVIVDGLPAIVTLMSADGEFEHANQSMLDYLGTTLEEMKEKTRPLGKAFHPDDRPGVLKRWKESIDTGQPYDYEARLRRVDGVYRWFHTRGYPLRDADGHIVLWYLLQTDIDARKQAEVQLERERPFGVVVDELPALITLMDSAGELQFANRHVLDYFGATLDELQHRPTGDSFHPDDRAGALAAWAKCVETGNPYDYMARQRRADGVHRWVHLLGSAMRNAEGRIVRWHFLQTDIDDAKRAEALLAGEKNLFEMVASGHPLLRVLDALCGLLDETAEGCLGGVLLLDPSGARVQHAIGPGLPRSYSEALEGRTVSCDAGPCGMAAVLKTQVIVSDAASDTRWDRNGWPALALAHGLKSCWSSPILSSSGDTFGTFAIYRHDGGVPTPFHQALMQKLAHIAAIAIGRTRSEDDRQRAEALVAHEKRLLEMVAQGTSLPLVLNNLCRLVEDMAGDCSCGILFYDPSGTTWQHGAAPSLPSGYNETMHGRPAHRASGPCGLAAAQKTQVIVSDVATDMRWDTHGWRTLALSHGLRACWSSPILAQDQKALGALAIYRREPGSPTPFQRDLIAQLSHIASIAVERSRSESALKRSEAFLAKAQQLSSTGSFSWRVATSEFTWSEEAHRIFGLAHGVTVTPDLIASCVHPEDMAILNDMIARARVDGGEFEHEFRLQMSDHSVKHVHLVAYGTRDEDDKPEYIGAIQDVTRRRLSEEALGKVRSELAHVARVTTLGALTASIAHEVNQPLSGIVTNASTCLRMLAADPPNVEGARETARRIIRDGNRASDVVTRLRTLFAKKAGASEPVDLTEVTREVIALSWSELQRRRVILRQDLAEDIPFIAGDRVQLQQVILNLILNAAEAMGDVVDRPRLLTIKTACDDAHVRLTVQDSGTGLAAEGIERLFDAFYTTKPDGMGIGLSVGRTIVESHHGRLWAVANDGPGATFAFSLPCRGKAVVVGHDVGAMQPSL